jgi:hypothetical protein
MYADVSLDLDDGGMALLLQRSCDLLCLCQPKSKVGHAGLFIALDAGDFHLRRAGAGARTQPAVRRKR